MPIEPIEAGEGDLIQFEVRHRRPITRDSPADDGVGPRGKLDKPLEILVFGPGYNVPGRRETFLKPFQPRDGHAPGEKHGGDISHRYFYIVYGLRVELIR